MKPTLEWLKNPEIFEVNREKAHSDHLCTVNGQQLKQSLNGTWKFNYCEHPDNKPADFYMVDFDVTGFDEIKVPGHIQLQGYDKPQYVNTQYPFLLFRCYHETLPLDSLKQGVVKYKWWSPETGRHAFRMCRYSLKRGAPIQAQALIQGGCLSDILTFCKFEKVEFIADLKCNFNCKRTVCN